MNDNPITQALSQPKDSIYYTMGNALRAAFPEMYLLETEYHFFDLHDFRSSGACEFRFREGFPNELDHYWTLEDGVMAAPYNAWMEISWEGNELSVFQVSRQGNHCTEHRHFLLAKSKEIAESFFEAVCRWSAEAHNEIFVFSDGYWQKSKDLFESIKTTALKDLILAGDLKEEILYDFRTFFESRERYTRHGIPWKRGVLFLGPPGNGKTHMIKALVNELDVPCLYVRSFVTEYQTSHHCISEAFERARQTVPCIFVFEDLDAMINEENRSFFLNEMDGFYSNEGILTIATTNHPERLDPAILERPSRFDRKYHFELPGFSERERYIAMVNAGREEELRLGDDEIRTAAESTDGFSYAYLKELFLSSMMAWMKGEGSMAITAIVLDQIEALRSQMMSSEPATFEFEGGEGVPEQVNALIRRFGAGGFSVTTRRSRIR